MNFKARDQSKDTIVQRRDDEQLEEMALAELRKMKQFFLKKHLTSEGHFRNIKRKRAYEYRG